MKEKDWKRNLEKDGQTKKEKKLKWEREEKAR